MQEGYNMALISRVFEVVDVHIANQDIQLLYTYWETPDPSDYAPETMHIHEFYELHASYDRDVEVRVGGKLIAIHPGQVLIIAPGTLHNATDPEARKLIFSYDIGQHKSILGFDEPWLIVDNVNTSRLMNVMFEVEQHRVGYYDAIRSLFVLLMLDVVRAIGRLKPDMDLYEQSHNYNTKFFLDAFFKMNIRWNYNKRELADMLHISTRQLERKINALYGMTYREKVQQVRFQNARLLLTLCKMPPARVAEILRYNNASSFSKAFKKFYGVTPAQMSKCDMNRQK